MNDEAFGEEVAARYDNPADPMFAAAEVDPAVSFLAELASDGRALEFGIGTGRIAVPLAGRGIRVDGIDLSRPMVERLLAKPGARAIGVTIGDFSRTRLDGSYRLVYLVYNTIGNVATQADQVECFRNAAAHLELGGSFVIEVGIPELRRLPPGEKFVVFASGPTHWGVDEYDVANQGLISHHFELIGDRFEKSAGRFRYVWPSELDLMAEIAGLRLRERWANWRREPFTSESRGHVSVWERPRL